MAGTGSLIGRLWGKRERVEVPCDLRTVVLLKKAGKGHIIRILNSPNQYCNVLAHLVIKPLTPNHLSKSRILRGGGDDSNTLTFEK